jgi:rhamnogalacturonan II specific xylosyltransferase
VDTAEESEEKWVMIVNVNDGYLDFFDNFWRHYLRITEWTVEHPVRVVCTSVAAASHIHRMYGDKIEVAFSSSDVGAQTFGFFDKGFSAVVQERPALIPRELAAGRNVLYLDVDIVLLADPWPHLKPGYDIWTSMDHEATRSQALGTEHCTGIMALVAVPRVMRLIADWETRMCDESNENPGRFNSNQKAFHQAIGFPQNSDLVVMMLPEPFLPPGSVYFTPEFMPNRSNVVAVHNNFIVAHDTKKLRFLTHGLWISDDAMPAASSSLKGIEAGSHSSSIAPTATDNLATVLDIKQIVKGGDNARPPIKSTCALLFFCLPKEFKGVVLPSIRKHILRPDLGCDVFMHIYNVTDWNTERHQERLESTRNVSLQPDGVHIFTEATGIMSETEDDFHRQRNMMYFERFFPSAPHHGWRFPGSLHNMIKQRHLIEQVWNLMVSHEQHPDRKHAEATQYMRVGLFRSDVEYQTDMDISDGDAITPCFNNKPRRMADWMFYGLRKYAECGSRGRFGHVERYMATEFGTCRHLHAEHFMFHLMGHCMVPMRYRDICFYRVQATGIIQDHDCSMANQGPSWTHDARPR